MYKISYVCTYLLSHLYIYTLVLLSYKSIYVIVRDTPQRRVAYVGRVRSRDSFDIRVRHSSGDRMGTCLCDESSVLERGNHVARSRL